MRSRAGLRLGAVLRERLVEKKRMRGESLQLGLLCRRKIVSVADEGAEDQREQQGDKADDRSDHVTRFFDRMLFWQKPLRVHSGETSGECQDRDGDGNENGYHVSAPLNWN